MTVDRKKIRQAVSKGEGEDDQVLSIANRAFGFRKPGELGASGKYWNYDPTTAKQLLSAAGVTTPIETNLNHWDAAVTGQAMVEHATLIQATWRELGIANAKDNVQTGAVYFGTTATCGAPPSSPLMEAAWKQAGLSSRPTPVEMRSTTTHE